MNPTKIWHELIYFVETWLPGSPWIFHPAQDLLHFQEPEPKPCVHEQGAGVWGDVLSPLWRQLGRAQVRFILILTNSFSVIIFLRYVLRDDYPFCIKCYENVFANNCDECGKIIGIDSKVWRIESVKKNQTYLCPNFVYPTWTWTSISLDKCFFAHPTYYTLSCL